MDIEEILKPETIAALIGDHFSRCEQHRLVGISIHTLIEEGRGVPEGWRIDYSTNYALPPNFVENAPELAS